MKVIFDLRAAQIHEQRGVGRYAFSLLEEIIKSDRIDAISVLISLKYPMPKVVSKYSNKIDIYTYENQEQYTFDDYFDFFFSFSTFLIEPYIENIFDFSDTLFPAKFIEKSRRTAAICYDLIKYYFPKNLLPSNEDKVKDALMFDNHDRISHIFAISDFTKDSLTELMKRNKDTITTIYGGIDKEYFRTDKTDKPYTYNERKDYIVDISGASESKNAYNLSKSFAEVYKAGKIPADSKLYIICAKDTNFEKKINKAITPYGLKLGNEVVLTGYIPDNEVKEIVSNAKALIHTSYIEGLGLPVLEAYAMGTPAFAGNFSATKDLVLAECSFNACDNNDIQNAIIKAFNNEKLCCDSLDFGRNILEKYNWQNCANSVIDKLYELKENINKQDKIAVYIPSKGSVAEYSTKIFSYSPDTFDCFSDFNTLKDYDNLKEKCAYTDNINLFDIENYPDMNQFYNYKHKIYVLGNSYYHLMPLKEAIKTKGEPNRWIYLPEPVAYELIKHYYNIKDYDFKDLVLKWYPEVIDKISDLDKMGSNEFILEHKTGFIRALYHLTGIKNYLIYSKKGYEFLNERLSKEEKEKLNVYEIRFPVEKIEWNKKRQLFNNGYTVGSFGIAHHTKQSNLIIKAVEKLRNEGFNVNLILAGYKVSSYVKHVNHCISKDNLLCIDNPTEDEFLTLMNSVDLAVQLRPKMWAATSGVVCELGGLGKQMILTKGLEYEAIESFCDFVGDNVSIDELASKIKEGLLNPKNINIDNTDFSNSKFSDTPNIIKNIILNT